MRFDPGSMELGPFLLFGSEPGSALPPLDGFKVATHTKGDAQGVKKSRLGLRVVPRSKFVPVKTIPELYVTLFGQPVNDKAPGMQGPSNKSRSA